MLSLDDDDDADVQWSRATHRVTAVVVRVKSRWIEAGRERAVDEVVDEAVETTVDEARATTKVTQTQTEDGCLHSVSVRAF